MNTLKKLKIETDLAPTVSAYKQGYKTLAIKRFNKLISDNKLMYWEMLIVKEIATNLILEKG